MFTLLCSPCSIDPSSDAQQTRPPPVSDAPDELPFPRSRRKKKPTALQHATPRWWRTSGRLRSLSHSTQPDHSMPWTVVKLLEDGLTRGCTHKRLP